MTMRRVVLLLLALLAVALVSVLGISGGGTFAQASVTSHASMLAQLPDAPPLSLDEYKDEFERFMQRHQRVYASDDERATRFDVFRRNLDTIRKHNQYRLTHTHATYEFGVGPFADLTPKEFRRRLSLGEFHQRSSSSSSTNNATTPTRTTTASRLSSVSTTPTTASTSTSATTPSQQCPTSMSPAPSTCDWRLAGLVTPIKNQLHCGACWAFSAAAVVESAWAFWRNGGTPVSLSEQYMIDCSSHPAGDPIDPCLGGQPSIALDFTAADGACAESDYTYINGPYTYCNTLCTPRAWISGTKYFDSPVETNMLTHVASTSPISAAIEADTSIFQHYSGGVINDAACGTNTDHAAAVIGYGVDASSNVEYWLLKNSWGTAWGEDGFVRLARGVNQCGIATNPIAVYM